MIAHGILNGIIVMKQNVGIIQIMKVIAIARQEAVHGILMECIVMNPLVGHMIMMRHPVTMPQVLIAHGMTLGVKNKVVGQMEILAAARQQDVTGGLIISILDGAEMLAAGVLII